MSTIVAKGVVKRRAGYMYFVDGNGNVGEAKMKKVEQKAQNVLVVQA